MTEITKVWIDEMQDEIDERQGISDKRILEIARKHCRTYATTNTSGAPVAYFGDVVKAIKETLEEARCNQN